MLNKSLLLATIIFANISFLNAKSLNKIDDIDNIVEKTYKNNYNLKALAQVIKTAKEQIELSSKLSNPILSFGANDIQFDDVTRRDLEAMQGQFIGFTQTFPLGDKLKISKDIAVNDYEISKYTVEDKKLQYKAKIYEYIYNIKLLKERLALFDEFKNNITKLESLLKEFYKYNKASQVEILNTQIIYQELNLKSQKLKTILNTITLKLEQITYEKIENINLSTKIEKIKLSTKIESHPKILSFVQSSKKFENISSLEKEKKNSDLKVSLNYFQREGKYKDYANIAFAIPLSIYESEDIKSRQAKFKALEVNHKLEDMKQNFKNQIKIYQENIDDSIITLNIINKTIIPKYKQLQKVLEKHNSSNTYKMIDSKSLINNFNETIKYKLKALDLKEQYFNNLSKSIYFTKEI